MKPFLAAAIQMTSGDDVAVNIAALTPLVEEAAARGASLITTPENVFYMRREGSARAADVPMAEHPGIVWAQGAARAHGVWVLIGSIRALEAGMEKPFNRSVLLSPQGEIAAFYDKMHLFDITLPDGQSYLESAQAVAGLHSAPVATDLAVLGLSICYDLRFAHLYRQLALGGATVLTVPSAFTRPTGQAHWEVLLRARAIETGSYVVAPAQCGVHPGGRETYGHSMIVDPWGTVLAQAVADVPGVIFAEIDPARALAVRAQIPVLGYRE